MAPNLRKVPPYNVLTDFTPISLVGLNTLYFVVNPALAINSMADLVAYSRANPGKLNAATGHTYAIVATGLFAKQNGLSIETIPYKSEPEAIVDLLSGRVDLMVSTSTVVYGHIKEKKLRALAGTTVERNPLMPGVPTLIEAGQQKHPFDSWFALVAPAGLPTEIATRMNAAVTAALTKPEARELMLKHGVVAKPLPLDVTAAYIKDQHEIWKTSLRDAAIELQ